MLPWLPWALATLFTAKIWSAVVAVRELRRRSIISDRGIMIYACVWLIATACLVLCSWLTSPRIEWLRNTMTLIALSSIPVVAIALAPFSVARNRHR